MNVGLVRWPALAAPAVALVLLVVSAWMFYPGYLTWDAAYQWYQVRTGRWDNVHPVAMTLVWSLADRVVPGPGGYFLLQLTLYWLGLAALAIGLYRGGRSSAIAVALMGLFPPVFALLPHVLKDVGLLVALIWAVALLVHEERRSRRWLRGLALVLIAMACAYRHNALPLALPFVWYLTGREPRLAASRGRRTLATVALMLLMALLAALPNRLPGVAQRQVWPITAIWDLAAVSIAENEMLLPASIIDQDLSVAELKTDFMPYAAVPVFASGKIRDSVGPRSFDDGQMSELNRAWLDLWWNHPRSYFAHRVRVAKLLFGFEPLTLPNALIVDYTVAALADNPPISPRQNRLQNAWQRILAPLLDSPVFAFWPYALTLLVAAFVAFVRTAHPLLAPVLWSALLLVLPLVVVAPGADFRFLLWPVFCSVLAIALLASGRKPAEDAIR